MGSEHAAYGKNNQDFGIEISNCACIVDGCSEGLHSEVGAKLFIKYFQERLMSRRDPSFPITEMGLITTFEDVWRVIIGYDKSVEPLYWDDVKNYLCFTIVLLQEFDGYWDILIAGDGGIITQTHDKMEFLSINHSDTPPYLAYAYLPQFQSLENRFQHFVFRKKEYEAIGIASDGLGYVIGTDYEQEFKELLLHRKEFAIKRLINQLNQKSAHVNGFFKDDITIIMGKKNDNL
jgi:hypothetical protein